MTVTRLLLSSSFHFRVECLRGQCWGPSFIIYINDLGSRLTSYLFIFADDTKVDGKAFTKTDCEIIQKGLNQTIEWSKKWKISFNDDKCKVMHTGFRISNHTHIMVENLFRRCRRKWTMESLLSAGTWHTRRTVEEHITRPTLCSGPQRGTSNAKFV